MSGHVVFGAGAIGRRLAALLADRGEQVTVVNRSGRADVPAGVPVLGGDARDPDFTTWAADGADVVYQVLNPPYARWAQEFPALQAGVLAAARKTGALLVGMDNVYMYGRPGGQVLTEDSPYRPDSRKGAVRAAMATELLAARDRGEVRLAVGRASDYFGPGGGGQSNLGDPVLAAAVAGKAARVLGDPDQPHSYTYIPDIARGLAALGTDPAAEGAVWHLPNAPAVSTRRHVEILYELAGHPPAAVRSTPPALLRLVGLVNPAVRELPEMLYEFAEPFVVDGTRAEQVLGLTATDTRTALAETLDHFRSR